MPRAPERFRPGRAGVEDLLEELATVPDRQFAVLARWYAPDEQAQRDAAWDRVVEQAAFHHRETDLREVREAVIDGVTVRCSAGIVTSARIPEAYWPLQDPLTQARIANAVIEAAGAILVADLVEDAVVEVLAGPVLTLLASVDEARAAEEHARRHRYDPVVD